MKKLKILAVVSGHILIQNSEAVNCVRQETLKAKRVMSVLHHSPEKSTMYSNSNNGISMKSTHALASGFVILTLAIAGCATSSSTPKLFNSANLVIKADNVITVPPELPKDFVETVRNRTVSITQAELVKQGDMNPVDTCGLKVMKITQDITAISMSQNQRARPLFFGVTQDTKQVINISTSLRLEDCQTGKLLYSYDYAVKGNNAVQLLQKLVAYNIKLAYRNQYQR
ncbi:MAG: hypothetical protein PHH59_09100 [Methylovulum sp.]|uniref:hypothetical protein n=1 Tax=Methylovulum sp. TaxID=1916980 RepID=UPI002625F25E|nr:hypothetical protein [Methylovulum sp.]MDD2724160.1 hypothetical protein [Methylovulum sp.]